MRVTRCRGSNCLPKLEAIIDSQPGSVSDPISTFRMNKFERHSPAGKQILPGTAAGDLSPTAAEVIDISDAPANLPRPPLTPSEVRTILMSLMLTMFLAALDQTI